MLPPALRQRPNLPLPSKRRTFRAPFAGKAIPGRWLRITRWLAMEFKYRGELEKILAAVSDHEPPITDHSRCVAPHSASCVTICTSTAGASFRNLLIAFM